MRKLWFLILVLITFTSCKTVKYIDRTTTDSTEVPIPITNTKIEYRDRFLYDSVYISTDLPNAI